MEHVEAMLTFNSIPKFNSAGQKLLDLDTLSLSLVFAAKTKPV